MWIIAQKATVKKKITCFFEEICCFFIDIFLKKYVLFVNLGFKIKVIYILL